MTEEIITYNNQAVVVFMRGGIIYYNTLAEFCDHVNKELAFIESLFGDYRNIKITPLPKFIQDME